MVRLSFQDEPWKGVESGWLRVESKILNALRHQEKTSFE